MTRARVAVARVRPTHAAEDVARLCALAGADGSSPALILATSISLRPSATGDTTAWQAEGALRWLAARGVPARWGSHAVPEVVRSVLARAGVAEEALAARVEGYRPRARLRALPRLFAEGLVVPSALAGAEAVYLPRLRRDRVAAMAGATLATLDALVGPLRRDARPWIHGAAVDALAVARELHPARLAVMDATTLGLGTDGEVPVDRGLALASRDLVALDAVGATLLGLDPRAVPHLALAHDDGLGVADPRDITLVGDDLDDARPPAARPPDAREGPFAALHRLAARTPLGALTSLAPTLRRDLWAWPAGERRGYDDWLRRSPWGALTARYAGARAA